VTQKNEDTSDELIATGQPKKVDNFPYFDALTGAFEFLLALPVLSEGQQGTAILST
jgi:hypothetical protein